MTTTILELLKQHWGYDRFRPMQEKVIHSVLSGTDTLALLPTGGGKSLCYQLPALAMDGMCIVISPLIALMQDQLDGLKNKGVQADLISSSLHHTDIDRILENACQGALKFLFVSPERLRTEIFQMRVQRMPINLIAVDEAHCISQWGHDFRPSYRQLREIREHLPDTPVLALTASATSEVVADINEQLGMRNPQVLKSDFAREELVYWLVRTEDKEGKLLEIAKRSSGSGIIYCRTRRETERTAELLDRFGINARSYHAGLDADIRRDTQSKWQQGTFRFVAATNAFGMGIDKSDVRMVVHMNAPENLESYYQEAGRAGRDKDTAHAILLASQDESRVLLDRVKSSYPDLTEVRKVYQSFADQHQIALGSGTDQSYTLDIRGLKKSSGIPIRKIAAVFKSLEMDGRIALSKGGREPSRIRFLVNGDELALLPTSKDFSTEIIQCLLRTYGGLFEELVVIEEETVARQLQIAPETVQRVLRRLSKAGVLEWNQRHGAPLVTLLEPRQDATTLTLNPESLDERKERAVQRADSMAGYIDDAHNCRSKQIQHYFTDTDGVPCGRCDNCIRRKATDHSSIKDRIRTRLQGGKLSIQSIVDGSSSIAETEIAVIRMMIDNGELVVGDDDRIALKV